MPGYLVQYGKPAYLGRFSAGDGATYSRGDRVVIDGPRGVEIGSVLCEPQTRFTKDEVDGVLLRAATSQDDRDLAENETRSLSLLAFARDRVTERALPLDAVDVELSLDRRTAVLHGIAWSDCDAGSLLEELSREFGVIVRFLDLARTPAVAEPAGCGKPGCGSTGGGCSSCGTGGGCSTSSCSRGKVKDARELTAYFADLRQQMERRVPLA